MEMILQKIQLGEGHTTEFKISFQKEVIESVVAFANAEGGNIFIGVDDKANIVGTIVNGETIQKYINLIKQNTQPSIIVDIEKYKLEQKTVLVIRVQEQPVKPVSYKNRYYKRVQNSNHQMNLDEIANEHLKTINASWDYYIDTRHDFSDISIEKAIEFISKIEKFQGKVFDDDIYTILRKYELIKEDKLTFGAYLLFVNNISSLTCMQVGRFKSDTMIIDSLSLNTDLINEIEQTLAFIRKNLMVEYIITGNAQREERFDYPLEAIREIVINMVAHRDYRDSGDSIIKIFDDRIEFFNPGKLYDDLTIEKLLSGDYSSRSRNRAVAKLFKEAGIIEKYGSGITRIRKECTLHKVKDPVFEEFQHGFRVVLFKEPTQENTKEKIIQLLKENGYYTKNDLMNILGKADGTIKEHIANLKKEGVLERVGSTKSGYWKVIK